MGIARKGGGGVMAYQDGLEHFFPRLPVRERGVGLKLFWQCNFKKGLP